MRLAITGAAAGLVFGYVLQRSDQCFHSTWRGLYEGRYALARAWILGVAIASVGLTAIYASGAWDGLNEGLAFRPVHNALGGLVIGVSMVVAASCASGLFYKLGSGMVGAAVGLAAWAAGELAAGEIDVPGPSVIGHGADASLPGWLGIPRWTVTVPFLILVVAALRRVRDRETVEPRWAWPLAGAALGAATVVTWMLAGIGGHSFGPSTVGAVRSVADGDPLWWLVAFLAAIVVGASIGARTSRTWWLRGERPARFVGLAAGGFLLGAGGRIGGGCNLGHGLSGVAQMNISSWLAVTAMIAGIGLARAVQRSLSARAERFAPPAWTPLTLRPGSAR